MPALCWDTTTANQLGGGSPIKMSLALLSGSFLTWKCLYPSVLPSPPQHFLISCHANTMDGQAQVRTRWPTVMQTNIAPAKKRKDMCTNTFNYTETLTLVETQTLANFVSSKSYDDIFSIYVLCNARHILWSLNWQYTIIFRKSASVEASIDIYADEINLQKCLWRLKIKWETNKFGKLTWKCHPRSSVS